MTEGKLKAIIAIFIIIFLWMFMFGKPKEVRYGDVNVQAMVSASEGLDLKAAGELLKKAKDAEQFERLLNEPGGVNNIDLNEDGQVDYIHVTEYGNEQSKGFSLTVQPAPGETQEVATIDIAKAGEKADVEIKGNEQVYGRNHYHHYSSPLTTFFLMSYLFRPHSMFYSPFGYGRYPGGYSPYRPVPAGTYRSRAANINRSSTAKSSATSRISNKAVSPNNGKAARSGIRAPLKNPTRSQKSFQARNPSRQAKVARSSGRSGGFGRSSSSRPSVRGGGFGRSMGSFGGK
ncbi:MAG: hypothetical protein GY868_04745 [Deltaproteobacteria bacterium]|nr:hypothetical protein [Deltaproteobacteria bacterium]